MRIEDIEIHVGGVEFPYEPVRRLEAKCEASSAFSPAPTMEEVNHKLREMAAGLGANAVVGVAYTSGVSMTSWRSMKGTGLAVRRPSDDMPCPSCAEVIKRAASKCRFCGADISPEQRTAVDAALATPTVPPASIEEPLRSTNNPQWWILAVVGFFLFMLLLSSL